MVARRGARLRDRSEEEYHIHISKQLMYEWDGLIWGG